ncbi:hypothetical protein BOS5A_200208 [Bosea sp. EC-HK365B]|nr:hypothetical protein BOSE21B_100207 [Bosea sp. 21B]CAD5285336.1 hypothetical protein BOSE7B_41322 [Bosea sp. 7B]VVT57661.1 hypothetical protein BOS5A_200208 [Bosea sp. EC-HK365B]VXB72605.1 hypothetical protein BOSE125_150017 [Bosea sp. 125]
MAMPSTGMRRLLRLLWIDAACLLCAAMGLSLPAVRAGSALVAQKAFAYLITYLIGDFSVGAGPRAPWEESRQWP